MEHCVVGKAVGKYKHNLLFPLNPIVKDSVSRKDIRHIPPGHLVFPQHPANPFQFLFRQALSYQTGLTRKIHGNQLAADFG